MKVKNKIALALCVLGTSLLFVPYFAAAFVGLHLLLLSIVVAILPARLFTRTTRYTDSSSKGTTRGKPSMASEFETPAWSLLQQESESSRPRQYADPKVFSSDSSVGPDFSDPTYSLDDTSHRVI